MESLTGLIELIGRYGPWFVFGWVLFQQAGVPLPAYPVLMLAGSLAAAGRHAAAAVLAAAMLGCLLADSLWYAAGRRWGNRVLRVLCRLSLSPDGCVRQTESIFARWGPPSLVVAKFIPGFAAVATAMAGSTGVPRAAFVVYDALGAALWAGVGLALGWVFAAVVEDVLLVLAEMGRWGLLLVLLVLAVFIAAKAWRRQRFHAKLRMDRISVESLAQMLDRGESPLVVDVRKALQHDDGRIPGAIVFDDERWPDNLRAPHGDAMVVVYCACPNEASAALVAKKLMQRGFKRVRPLQGGIDAWRAAGLRVEPPGEAPPLSSSAAGA